MGEIYKGTIATINGSKARVVPLDRVDQATARLIIPQSLQSGTGALVVGDEVVYVQFGDGTGIILARMDGESA